jgi:hypothetical protein
MAVDGKPRAELRTLTRRPVRDPAADIKRRHEDEIGVLRWSGGSMPPDLYSLIREAHVCYVWAAYLGAIAMSSAAVELIMNKDRRAKSLALGRTGNWATLTNVNLALVQTVGFPVPVLLEAGETAASQTPITFVRRRNKVAHGDFGAFIKGISDYNPAAEAEARDQVLKAQLFVVEWFNTAPDVQDGLLKYDKWPA